MSKATKLFLSLIIFYIFVWNMLFEGIKLFFKALNVSNVEYMLLGGLMTIVGIAMTIVLFKINMTKSSINKL